RLLAGAQHRLRERLRLVDRRNRLRLLAELLAVAVELRRVDRGGVHDGDVDAPTGLLQLDARRLEEVPQRRLRGAVASLQRDAAISRTHASSPSLPRAVTTTLAPRCPASRATARPSPLEAPVTTITWRESGSLFATGFGIPTLTRLETGYHRRMPNIGPWEII